MNGTATATRAATGRKPNPDPAVAQGLRFVRAKPWLVVAISVAMLVPCFWHRRLEAGDLASHTYSAWLAQLINRGQAPGLYTVRPWTNVLVDVALERLSPAVGLAAAAKIATSVCVLVLFWGAFALIAAATQRRPWLLVPAIAMITYGWSFQMGFMNYCLSFPGFGIFCGSSVLARAAGRLAPWAGADSARSASARRGFRLASRNGSIRFVGGQAEGLDACRVVRRSSACDRRRAYLCFGSSPDRLACFVALSIFYRAGSAGAVRKPL